MHHILLMRLSVRNRFWLRLGAKERSIHRRNMGMDRSQKNCGGMIAVDIGKSRIKFGYFVAGSVVSPNKGTERLPEPDSTFSGSPDALDALSDWLSSLTNGCCESSSPSDAVLLWRIASVNRSSMQALKEWLTKNRSKDRIEQLKAADTGLDVVGPDPARVGIDRLVDALAADRLREPSEGAIVVDTGSAITIDLVAPDGSFRGGVILPGLAMGARSLHDATDQLPHIDTAEFADVETAAPDLPGLSTESAMRAGLFWNAVGGIREAAARMQETLGVPCRVILTGGDALSLAPPLSESTDLLPGLPSVYVPHLTLAGIRLANLRRPDRDPV